MHLYGYESRFLLFLRNVKVKAIMVKKSNKSLFTFSIVPLLQIY